MNEREQPEGTESGERRTGGVLTRLGLALLGVAVLALVVYLVGFAFDGEEKPRGDRPTGSAAQRFSPEKPYDATGIAPDKIEVCRLVGKPVATALRLKREPGPGGLECTWSFVDFDPQGPRYLLTIRVDPKQGLSGTTRDIAGRPAVRTRTADRCAIAYAIGERARVDMVVSGGPDACNRIDVVGPYLANWLPTR